MALADLIARLEREAEARASELEARIEREAAVLEAKAAVRGAERLAHELRHRREARRARLDAALADARRASQRARLEAQHAFLERVFARARALLPELARSEACLASVPRQFEEASRYLGGVPAVVRCSREVASRLPPSSEDLKVEVAELDSPGFVLEAADGSVIVDQTLGARLELARPHLSVRLVRRLAEGSAC